MASALERFYPHAPLWLQNVGITLYGYAYKRERFGGGFSRAVKEFREREFWPPARLEAYRQERLRRTVLHAFDEVPYYREKWSAAGINRSFLQTLAETNLSALPITPKSALRQNPDSFVSRGSLTSRELRRYHTSGSTGTPVTVTCSLEDRRRFVAAREARSFGWACTSVKMPRAMLGGRMVVPKATSPGPYYRYNHAERQVYFSAYHIRPGSVADYVEGFNRYRPMVMTGYAYSYYILARMMLEHRLSLEYTPKALVLSSEKLTAEMKKVISLAFGARAYEEYGSVENCVLATECEGGGLHVSSDFGIVEIVDDEGNPVPDGREGRILCTGLANETQPLIRYEIGDVGAWSKNRCSCGRDQFPLLEEIVGRLEDVVVGPDGREMVRFHGLFVNIPHVLEGQVIQEELDLIRLRVVTTPSFGPEQEKRLRERLVRERLGAVRVMIDKVPFIERTERGKFRAVVSRLSSKGEAATASTQRAGGAA